MRQFNSGAIRDSDDNKLDYEGFFSPIVIKCFAEYMHKHRKLPDGSIRDSDNWQKGVPQNEYIKSADRHFMDVKLHHRGFPNEATNSQKDALCGVLFNTMGYLYEILIKEKSE